MDSNKLISCQLLNKDILEREKKRGLISSTIYRNDTIFD